MPRTGSVVVAYDATPASERALREAAAFLAGRPAPVLGSVSRGVIRAGPCAVVVVRENVRKD
ncbi:hypothetical protein [Candidatus Solirubrobacter pratensis]|uniref:hypothetical protein n=1 Tax=Candidatus Solirubrobacter pratensis TaxID=1298857 RepID=UPI0003FA700A|nr:hypothetical protein [Candidatus Solirubrobacter pratensis]